MGDAADFLELYQHTLDSEAQVSSWPENVTKIYDLESCLKHRDDKAVYVAIDRRTGGKAVIRSSVFDPREGEDTEYEILSKLSFPGVPKAYGFYHEGTRSYLSREYFEGQPLDAVVARGTFSVGQAYDFAKKMCIILDYLHSQVPPVIHRDIKPQNIILQPDGTIGLTDFGIARTYKEESSSDTEYAGTLAYAAPEQYGYAQTTPQTDIYSLGITLIYLVTGSPIRDNLETRISDRQLRTLIERCIAFDPADRYRSARQITKYIDGLRTRRLRRILGAASGSVAAALIVGAIVFSILNMPQADGGSADGAAVTGDQQGGNNQATQDSGSGRGTEYSYSNDPRVGSTNWLYDYNNDGNLPGNLNNGGFAVADPLYRHEIYLIDNGKTIYALDEEGNVLRTLYEGTSVKSLNYYNKKLYFSSFEGLVSLDVSTGDTKVLVPRSVETVFLDNGRLYYTNAYENLDLYTVKLDGSTATKVIDGDQRHYENVIEGFEYYSDGNDGNRIYSSALDSATELRLNDINSHWVSVCNGRIYFSDHGNTAAVKSMALDGSDPKTVIVEPYYYLVATPRGIFGVNAMEKTLDVMSADGSSLTVLTENKSDLFCVTDEWIFYENESNGGSIWMMRLDGTDNHRFEV